MTKRELRELIKSAIQEYTGTGASGGNAVYRIMPRSTDQIRGYNNPKIVYKADKVESGLKGELRASDYHLTKYKKKSYRDRDFGDFLPSSAPVNKRKVDGKVKTPNTNRSVSKSEFGHLNKTHLVPDQSTPHQ